MRKFRRLYVWVVYLVLIAFLLTSVAMVLPALVR